MVAVELAAHAVHCSHRDVGPRACSSRCRSSIASSSGLTQRSSPNVSSTAVQSVSGAAASSYAIRGVEPPVSATCPPSKAAAARRSPTSCAGSSATTISMPLVTLCCVLTRPRHGGLNRIQERGTYTGLPRSSRMAAIVVPPGEVTDSLKLDRTHLFKVPQLLGGTEHRLHDEGRRDLCGCWALAGCPPRSSLRRAARSTRPETGDGGDRIHRASSWTHFLRRGRGARALLPPARDGRRWHALCRLPAIPSARPTAFGIARTTGTPSAIRASMRLVGMAGGDREDRLLGRGKGADLQSSASMSWGFTATTTISSSPSHGVGIRGRGLDVVAFVQLRDARSARAGTSRRCRSNPSSGAGPPRAAPHQMRPPPMTDKGSMCRGYAASSRPREWPASKYTCSRCPPTHRRARVQLSCLPEALFRPSAQLAQQLDEPRPPTSP